MGLKSKLNKMKSFLFDEEDDDKEYKKPQKKFLKPEKKVAIEQEDDFSKTGEIEELSFDDDQEPSYDDVKEIKSRTQKTEVEFKFPEFDDDDFMVSKTKPEPIVELVKEEPKRVLYQGSKRKEETKKFKPSPIISPIYGLLDKDGNTVQKESKTSDYKSFKEEVSIDDVRKKAYGSFDEELENTMKRLSKKTIEEAEKDMEEEEKLFEAKASKVSLEEPIIVNSDDEDDDMILPNVNFKEIDVDKEKNKNDKKNKEKKEEPDLSVKLEITTDDEDDDEDTKEQDLFNLIDSMYQKEGDEE